MHHQWANSFSNETKKFAKTKWKRGEQIEQIAEVTNSMASPNLLKNNKYIHTKKQNKTIKFCAFKQLQVARLATSTGSQDASYSPWKAFLAR